MTLRERLQAPGPKRILALDGGGIRGALSLGFVARIEQVLRERHGRGNLVLADYFDLIGGTSTGAIIAAGLAIGMSAEEITRFYLDFGGEVFGERQALGFLRGRFSAEPLRRKLAEAFGEMRLGDPRIRTGLCIVTKRADTNSAWPLLNHPDGRFYRHNCDMLLADVVRASTAAPTYFEPEELEFAGDDGVERALFIDGGVSMHNTPALLLFLIATLQGYPFHWPTGDDKLLLVSIGTGYWQVGKRFGGRFDNAVWEWSSAVPGMLVNEASLLALTLLQAFSQSPTAFVVDQELGDLGRDLIGGRPLLSFLRYNVELDAEPLSSLGFADIAARTANLRDMTNAADRDVLNRIGIAAARTLDPAHLPAAFDLQ